MNTTRRSPFRPSFGTTPPVLLGRQAATDAVVDALDDGVGAPGRVSIATGARGIGKTVWLNEVEDQARERGWLVVSETLTAGLLRRVEDEHVVAAWRQLRGETPPDPSTESPGRSLTGLSLPGGAGVTLEHRPADELVGLRANLAELADALGRRGAGVLLTIDEMHRARGRVREELQVLAALVQHLWREERPIAFAGAGLPAAVHDVLNDDVLTFLRRAQRFSLGFLSPDDVDDGLRLPVREAGRDIEDAAVTRAVELVQGYPYLLQIVGDLAWRAEPDTPVITVEHVDRIADRAVRTLGWQVHQPAVADLSERDRDVLRAMLPDEGSSTTRALQARLDVDHPYLSRYRQRLIVSGMIRPDGRGRVAFALPYLREYLESTEL